MAKLLIEVQELRAEIADLKKEVEADRKYTASVYDYAKSIDKAHESLRTTFNKNVVINNEEAVRRMTARGACGTAYAPSPNGGQALINKPCTIADLR